MKKIGILIIVCLCVVIVFAGPALLEKPTISTAQKWDMTGKYYMRVTLADGSTVELKDDNPLTKAQWQKKANKYQKDSVILEPEICPCCGQPMP